MHRILNSTLVVNPHNFAAIYKISVACNKDKYQINSVLPDQLLHNSLGKECPAAFWYHLHQLTIPANAFYITTSNHKARDYLLTLN